MSDNKLPADEVLNHKLPATEELTPEQKRAAKDDFLALRQRASGPIDPHKALECLHEIRVSRGTPFDTEKGAIPPRHLTGLEFK